MTVKDGTTTDDIYPSRFLKADDIPGKAIFTIVDVNSEVVGEDSREKLIVSFKEIAKDLVLNKTNVGNIEEMYGKLPNSWIGKRVTMYTTFVDFRGKSVEAVRIEPKIPTGEPVQLPQPEPEEMPF